MVDTTNIALPVSYHGTIAPEGIDPTTFTFSITVTDNHPETGYLVQHLGPASVELGLHDGDNAVVGTPVVSGGGWTFSCTVTINPDMTNVGGAVDFSATLVVPWLPRSGVLFDPADHFAASGALSYTPCGQQTSVVTSSNAIDSVYYGGQPS